jgi:hypothetical protein
MGIKVHPDFRSKVLENISATLLDYKMHTEFKQQFM